MSKCLESPSEMTSVLEVWKVSTQILPYDSDSSVGSWCLSGQNFSSSSVQWKSQALILLLLCWVTSSSARTFRIKDCSVLQFLLPDLPSAAPGCPRCPAQQWPSAALDNSASGN